MEVPAYILSGFEASKPVGDLLRREPHLGLHPHQLNLAREYGGRMVALREGKIDLDIHMDSVADEQLQEIYTIQTASVGRGSES